MLADVTSKLEQAYTNAYLSELAKKWQPLVDEMPSWNIEDVVSQRSFFDIHVSQFVSKGKRLFVIISHALRYETMEVLECRIPQKNRIEMIMNPPLQ